MTAIELHLFLMDTGFIKPKDYNHFVVWDNFGLHKEYLFRECHGTYLSIIDVDYYTSSSGVRDILVKIWAKDSPFRNHTSYPRLLSQLDKWTLMNIWDKNINSYVDIINKENLRDYPQHQKNAWNNIHYQYNDWHKKVLREINLEQLV